MVRLNENSIVRRIEFVEKLSLNRLIGTECNFMPNLDLPGCMIHKDATTMKHYLSISVSLLIIQTSRESVLKVIHRDPLTRNQIVLLKFHNLYLSLTTMWVLVGWQMVFPNRQYAHLTLSQLATALGFFTVNWPVLARKRMWLNPIRPIRNFHYSSSLWSAVWF